MKLLTKTLTLTFLLLLSYFIFLTKIGFETKFAESNFVANQIRMQAVDAESGDLSIIAVGSSLTARLKLSMIEADKKSLNLGLDGSNAIFGMNQILNDGKTPDIILVELNTVYRDTSRGDKLLLSSKLSGTSWLAKHFALVRAKNRPVTMIYSKLKSEKDSRAEFLLKSSDYRFIRPRKTYTTSFDEEGYLVHEQLESAIQRALDKNIRVVLLIMPQGVNKPFKHEVLATKLMGKFDLEILDLLTPLANDLIYSDGTHLAEPSAIFVTEVIEQALKK